MTRAHNAALRLFSRSILAVVSLAVACGGLQAAAAPKLTCTFIHERCMTECVKQAGRGFCQLHCSGERRNCMATGRWDSFGRKFENVLKR